MQEGENGMRGEEREVGMLVRRKETGSTFKNRRGGRGTRGGRGGEDGDETRKCKEHWWG